MEETMRVTFGKNIDKRNDTNEINSYRLNDSQLAYLMRISIARKLTKEENINPKDINVVGKSIMEMDMLPYVELLDTSYSTYCRDNLVNLLVEDISVRLYINLFYDHSIEFIRCAVNEVLSKYKYNKSNQ